MGDEVGIMLFTAIRETVLRAPILNSQQITTTTATNSMSNCGVIFTYFHPKTFGWISVFGELALVLPIGVYVAIDFIAKSGTNQAKWAYILELFILLSFSVLSVFYAIALKTHRPKLIVPHLLATIVVIMYFFVMIIVVPAKQITGWYAVYFILADILLVYFLILEWRCFIWMCDYEPLNPDHLRYVMKPVIARATNIMVT
uniref:Uncharacterized protein n=1 Tax=Plectus sambesii TaxID=2011161 RepID=A0A914X6X6_9BILA